MKAAFHYLVKAKLIRKIEGKELDFEEINKKFENENPIIARKEAFNHYQSWIDILLQDKGKEYVTDKEARKDLISFIEPGATAKLKTDDKEIEFNDESFGNGVGVYFVADQPPCLSDFDIGEEVLIHGIGNFGGISMHHTTFFNLFYEFEYYKHYNYETKNTETEITYCMRDAWQDDWEEDGLITEKILKTPFNWKGYDKPYWWGEPEETALEPLPKIIEEIIQQGESNTVEFKSTLVYNIETKEADNLIKEMIAKTICGFLNSKGGVLFIGINDDGLIQGLDFDFSLAKEKNPKDYFQLVFDETQEHLLGLSRTHRIKGQFYPLEGKEIYIVEVSPNITRPTFVKRKGEKKFYVRLSASTRQIVDIEEIVSYWLERQMDLK